MTSLVAYLALLQLVLPLVMIVLNAIVTPVSRVGVWVRCAGLFALLIYLRLCGVWLFPPWWTPYLLGLLHVAGTCRPEGLRHLWEAGVVPLQWQGGREP